MNVTGSSEECHFVGTLQSVIKIHIHSFYNSIYNNLNEDIADSNNNYHYLEPRVKVQLYAKIYGQRNLFKNQALNGELIVNSRLIVSVIVRGTAGPCLVVS